MTYCFPYEIGTYSVAYASLELNHTSFKLRAILLTQSPQSVIMGINYYTQLFSFFVEMRQQC